MGTKGQYASSTPPDPSLGFPGPQLPVGGHANLSKFWAEGSAFGPLFELPNIGLHFGPFTRSESRDS